MLILMGQYKMCASFRFDRHSKSPFPLLYKWTWFSGAWLCCSCTVLSWEIVILLHQFLKRSKNFKKHTHTHKTWWEEWQYCPKKSDRVYTVWRSRVSGCWSPKELQPVGNSQIIFYAKSHVWPTSYVNSSNKVKDR